MGSGWLREERDKVYEALIDGTYKVLVDDDINSAILTGCPGTSDRLIIKASALALVDSDVIDHDVLRAIYGLAIARGIAPKPTKTL